MMNKIRSSKLAEFSSGTLALLTIVLSVTVSSALAKEHKPKGSGAGSQVVAHISFSGLSAVDMSMQRKVNDKYYLYVEHSEDQGISIIDISKPAQPKAVGVIPRPNPALSSRMSLTGAVAIISESQVFPMQSRTSTDDLVLWDLSNPAAPRVVQKFSGVVKYVLNGDGLWVASEPADRQPEQTGPSLPYGD
jgi:LVIVD repeat-containing protein